MPTKLIIIGGVAGGATAAARARRLDESAEIILFERDEYISFANCGLPYYIGNVIRNRDHLLVTTPEAFRERYKIDIRNFCEVTKIDRAKKQVEVNDRAEGKVYYENYDKIILSPGAEPARPPIEGIDLPNIFRLRNIPDTDRIKAYLDKKRHEAAVIIGAGFIGLEMAENLSLRGVKTTVIEALDQVLAPLDYEMAAIVQAHLGQMGIACELGNGVTSFKNSDGRITVVTNSGKEFEADIVLLSIGVKPEIRLAKGAGLELGASGAIKVDAAMRTSDPDIFAVGDAVEVRDFVSGMPVITPLAGPANKQGRIAANNALGRNSVFKGTQGSAILKLFDMVIAVTGANEKILLKSNIPYKANITHSPSHATYYPGANTMVVKILFSPDNGKLLGGQIIGRDGVDKRIDILATAIRAGMTVFDLEELELAYAPPFSSAKDPVNIAGYAASNIIKGDVEAVFWTELKDLLSKGYIYLDVRDRSEIYDTGAARGSINIPLNQLRTRLYELDKSKKYIVYCAAGLRSYIACRILTQNGFSVKNLSGGYEIYKYIKDKVETD